MTTGLYRFYREPSFCPICGAEIQVSTISSHLIQSHQLYSIRDRSAVRNVALRESFCAANGIVRPEWGAP